MEGLELLDFRNYEQAVVELGEGPLAPLGVAYRPRVESSLSPLHLHRHLLARRPVFVQMARGESELGFFIHENRHPPPFILERELIDF